MRFNRFIIKSTESKLICQALELKRNANLVMNVKDLHFMEVMISYHAFEKRMKNLLNPHCSVYNELIL